MKIAGFDIGGANTDLAVVEFDADGEIANIRSDHRYLPMWTKKNQLPSTLIDLLGSDNNEIVAIGVAMTAELADSYQNKSEGVMDIASIVMDSFDLPVGFVGLRGVMEYEEVKNTPLDLAAANWIATAPLAAYISSDCILIDSGSTTTDIIPIKNGEECARGRTDLERLITGELVYTGTLRTNVATIVDKVPLKDEWVRVASEFFALTADVHLVLGNIANEDYTCETPDYGGRSMEDCLLRLSRLVCGDLDLLSNDDVLQIAEHIYRVQVEKVAEALNEVADRENLDLVVATGLGMDIIGSKAAEILDLEFKTMDEILTREACVVAPAVGTALLMEKYMEKGRN